MEEDPEVDDGEQLELDQQVEELVERLNLDEEAVDELIGQVQDEEGNVDYAQLLELLQSLAVEAEAGGEAGAEPAPGSYVRALYDYAAQDTEELSIREDEVLIFEAIDEETNWYLLRRTEGAEAGSGLVPSNYVEVLEQEGGAVEAGGGGEEVVEVEADYAEPEKVEVEEQPQEEEPVVTPTAHDVAAAAPRYDSTPAATVPPPAPVAPVEVAPAPRSLASFVQKEEEPVVETKKPSRSPRRAAPSRPRAAPPPAPLTLPTAHDPFSVPKSEPKGNMLFKAAALKATGISPADVKAATAAPKMAALFDDEKMAKLMPSFHSKMDGVFAKLAKTGELDNLKKKNSTFSQHMASLDAEIATKQEKVAAIIQQQAPPPVDDAVTKKVAMLEAENARLKASLFECESQLVEASGQASASKMQKENYAKLEKRCAQLEAQNGQLVHDNTQLETQFAGYSNLQAENSRIAARCEALENDNVTAMAVKINSENDLMQMKARLTMVRRQASTKLEAPF